MTVCLFVFAALLLGGCERGEAQDAYGTDAYYYEALLARLDGDEDKALSLFAKCAVSSNSIAARRSKAEISADGTLEKKTTHTIGSAPGGPDDEEAEDAPSSESDMKDRAKTLVHKYIIAKQYEKAYSLADDAIKYINANPHAPLSHLVSDIGKAAIYAAGNKAERALLMDTLVPSVSHAADNRDAVYNAYFYAGRLYAAAGDIATARSRFYSAVGTVPVGKKSDNALWYMLNMKFGYIDSKESELSAMGVNGVSGLEMALQALNNCHVLWFDASYFDDILGSLSQKLLSRGLFAEYVSVCAMLLTDKAHRKEVYATSEVVARYVYVYARLVQEGFVQECTLGLPTAKQAFEIALDGATDRYFLALALTKLAEDDEGWKDKDLVEETVLCTAKLRDSHLVSESRERIEKFLMGFADFGLVQMIYPEWKAAVGAVSGGTDEEDFVASAQEYEIKRAVTEEKTPYINMDCAVYLSKALYKAGQTEQGLRIMHYAVRTSDTGVLTREALECLFPRGYKDEIEDACKKFDVKEEYAFALVRSESFFNNEAVSAAGAIGLTQLMPDTARDVARSLKKDIGGTADGGEDLTDAELNIELGLKYLSDLTGRVDGPPLIAFLSYNTGLTRIRRYVKGNNASARPLPLDLLLEVLPYHETRDYGRKLVSAAVMYGYLYYDKSVQSAVNEVMQWGDV